MNEIELYKKLKFNKNKLGRKQYSTIKGQIRKGDLQGAYKGICKCLKR